MHTEKETDHKSMASYCVLYLEFYPSGSITFVDLRKLVQAFFPCTFF